jgi:hypothetical protein
MIRVPAGVVGDLAVRGRRERWAEFVAEDLEPIGDLSPGQYVQHHLSISWRLNSGRLVAGIVLADADSLAASVDNGGYPKHVGVTVDHTGEARSILAPGNAEPSVKRLPMWPDWACGIPGYLGGAFVWLYAEPHGNLYDDHFFFTRSDEPSRYGAWQGFLRLSWLAANTFRFHVSRDGSTWEQVAEDLTFTDMGSHPREFSPTHVGGFAVAYRGRTDATCTYEILERSTGLVDG